MIGTLKTIVLFILLMSIIVSIHELGHLIAAKIFGVYCQEYSIGMGPKIFSKQFKETEFCIRAFPLGGFVAMAGEPNDSLETEVDTTNIPFERTLPGIAAWKRIIVMLAGIFMNAILAIVIYSLIICSNGVYGRDSKPVIAEFIEGYPAENCGLEVGDIVTCIEFENGAVLKPQSYSEIVTFASAYYEDGNWTVHVKRDDKELIYKVEPQYDAEEERYMIGIGFENRDTDYVETNIFNCWIYGADFALLVVRITFTAFANLLKGIGLDQLSGPVGIYKIVETATKTGISYYFELVAMISINVGLFNALPLPIFDGGRVFLTLIELIIGRPLSKKTQDLIMKISVGLVLALFVYVTFNDVMKLFRG